MPAIYYPQTGTKITWPSTDAGRIRITAWLYCASEMRIELSFKREPFQKLFRRSNFWSYLRGLAEQEAKGVAPLTGEEQAELDRFRPQLWEERPDRLPPDLLLHRWGDDIASTLQQDAYAAAMRQEVLREHTKKRPSRKPIQTLNGTFCGIDYRLSLAREDLHALRISIATDTGAGRLAFNVHWYLLPTALIEYGVIGLPRGHARIHFRQNVMVVARSAIYVARQLIAEAREDLALHRRLAAVLSAANCEGAFSDNYQVMALADRALRPALAKAGLSQLEGRSPSELLDPESAHQLADMFKHMPNALTDWFDMLLGPEGQAARKLQLVR